MAIRDITPLMNAYRECSRSLWNVYFSGREDVGASLDAFEQIRLLLFDSLVSSELCVKSETAGSLSAPTLQVVPRSSSLILIKRTGQPGEAGYWDEERDLVVDADDVKLAFVDYFDFSEVPIKDFHTFAAKWFAFQAVQATRGERLSWRSQARGFFTRTKGTDSPGGLARLTASTQYAFLPGQTFTNTYGYDAASNRTSFTAPDGSTNTYVYDTLNRLSSLTNSWAGQFGFGYDTLNRRTSLTRPNGVSTSYTYDSLSRLLGVLHQAGTTVLDGATYTLDNAGNRARFLRDRVGNTNSAQ
jgi:YD repeat-containing protein